MDVQGHPSGVVEIGAGLRVEVDPQLVGCSCRRDGSARVELDRRHLHAPHDVGDGGDTQLVGVPTAREAHPHRLKPVGMVSRHPLLVDRLAVGSVGMALEHARPLAQRPHDPSPTAR
jgi:hypothetical protein